MNSTWQHLSTSSEAVGFSYYEIYAWNFSVSKLFYREIIEQCWQYISALNDSVCAFCVLYALLSVAYVCALKYSSALD